MGKLGREVKERVAVCAYLGRIRGAPHLPLSDMTIIQPPLRRCLYHPRMPSLPICTAGIHVFETPGTSHNIIQLKQGYAMPSEKATQNWSMYHT